MRKLLFYFFALVAPIVSVYAAEPDTSDLTSLQDVFEVLDSQPVTYLDLKIERASRVLTTQKKHGTDFSNLRDHVGAGEFQATKDGKIVCRIEAGKYIEMGGFSIDQKIVIIKMVYEDTLSLAKKHISPAINENNLILYITSGKGYFDYDEKLGHSQWVHTGNNHKLVKFENGQAFYYEAFFQ